MTIGFHLEPEVLDNLLTYRLNRKMSTISGVVFQMSAHNQLGRLVMNQLRSRMSIAVAITATAVGMFAFSAPATARDKIAQTSRTSVRRRDSSKSIMDLRRMILIVWMRIMMAKRVKPATDWFVRVSAMIRPKGVLILLGVLGLLAFSTGCGGASDADLQQAKEEGAKEAVQAEKLKEIQKGIAALKKQRRKGNFKQITPPPASTGSTYSGSGPAKTCANGVGASSATSCDFAFNVAGEYGSNPGVTSISAFSPVTGQDYTMTCSAWSGGGTVCRGGNDAAVFIP